MAERVYIDAEFAKDAICKCYITDDEKLMLIRRINRIPAADVVEVRHGRWHDVYLSGASSFVGTCSVCGKTNDIPPVPLAKYCPSCGAKMDGGTD
jgi:hypothetical protein